MLSDKSSFGVALNMDAFTYALMKSKGTSLSSGLIQDVDVEQSPSMDYLMYPACLAYYHILYSQQAWIV